MKKQLKFLPELITGLILIILSGCATPGQSFIDINYFRSHDKAVIEQNKGKKIGISSFKDLRSGTEKGYIGHRVLNDKTRETYMIKGLNLGSTLQKTFMTYYEKNGFTPVSIKPWELSPEGVQTASKELTQIIAGEINKFECQAQKKGPMTKMTLDIDLTIYTGNPGTTTLKTIPVTLQLERTEINFTPQKLEHFVIQAVEDIMKKALIFDK